ncbi:MAG: KTSC domain-containing protein [Gammaproteobacteria bacterium]|nr:MAG: KTSC domain-containing protein [Gammaproteobacteria bacterium]
MEMIQVQSNAISAVGYEASTQKLKIKFHQGHSYDFCHVPLSVYQSFIKAPSKGAFYDSHIKDRYQC